MRILLITGSFPPMRCGVGDYTYQLALSLARNPQVTVAVLTSIEATSLSPEDGVVVIPIVKSWAWKEFRTIIAAIRKWAPAVIHMQFPTLGYGFKSLPSLLPLALRLEGFPIVQTWHEVEPLGYLFKAGLLLRFLARAIVPGGLVVVHADFQRRTHRVLRWAFRNKNVRAIPNASAMPKVELSPDARRALRMRYARPNAHMIAYFGFIYPRKRVEILFEIVEPDDSHIVIVGDAFREEDVRHFPPATYQANANYSQSLRRLANGQRWTGKVTMTGFLADDEVARVLAAADAVILPILDGGGGWNTSVHAAQAQGTFVLTTSKLRQGYDPLEHTYFAGENDLEDMRRALREYQGKRVGSGNCPAGAWQAISHSHLELYRTQIPGDRSGGECA